jgi:hypothetical protein
LARHRRSSRHRLGDVSDIRPVDRIGSYWENPKTRTFAELGID